MSYFAMSYQVLFHDTMAYGTHHYMTNFKFQNIARETVVFASHDGKGVNVWKDQLTDMVLLTREAYALNFAPVELGQKVAILLTYEAPTRSTFRLCFRVVRDDGSPVSCGYQTMVAMHQNGKELLPAPKMITRYQDINNEYSTVEPLQDPCFAEVLKGGKAVVKKLFTPEVIKIGKFIANAPRTQSYPRIINEDLQEFDLGDGIVGDHSNLSSEKKELKKSSSEALVFTFPGQGGYQYKIIKELYDDCSDYHPWFNAADLAARKFLRHGFLPLVQAQSQEAHDKLLAQCQDLNQIGIYLTEVIISAQMIDRGLKPSLLLGHSFGELAALATAGVFTVEQGLEIVCHRVLALQTINGKGQMGALFCGPDKASALLRQSGLASLEISVVNHPKQTVVSGDPGELDRLADQSVKEGISLTKLQSAYPFHSSFLAAAVKPFKQALSTFDFKPGNIPVYLCTEGGLYSPDRNIPEILSSQFIRTLNFSTIVHQLHQEGYRNFVECGAGNIVTKLVQKNLKGEPDITTLSTGDPQIGIREGYAKIQEWASTNGISLKAAPKTTRVNSAPVSQEEVPVMPIAIVSMGSVLPGAGDPDTLWKNLKEGKSGVLDIAKLNPDAATDFVKGNVIGEINIVPDKTYTLLNGTIPEVPYQVELLSSFYNKEKFEALTRGQKLLAMALAQTLARIKGSASNYDTPKIQCILGATADGTSEFDEALFFERMYAALDRLDEPENLKAPLHSAMHSFSGFQKGDSEALSQNKIYTEVVHNMLGRPVTTYLVDSACSSSLYSINLGAKSLRTHESDIVLAGGVFAPGPANNTLFAQFRGLTPTQSRPFDAGADGVIFGDGAGIVALKRLPDALKDGDEILGVIRGMGTSSDGKSPSINVPRAKGQGLAVSRAYERGAIDPNTIQFVEAHATATPVGDSVEFKALQAVLGKDRTPGLAPIELGSSKALIGHTGWVSGLASVVKMLKAFEEKIIPKQYNYETPNPEIHLEGSGLSIPDSNRHWPENIDGFPRRCGINGFGFGGTNLHLILEEFNDDYHQRLCSGINIKPPTADSLVVVGFTAMFPGTTDLASDIPTSNLRFDRSKLHLPKRKLLLPDVTDAMDISQYLSALAVEKILETIPEQWPQLREDSGVVLGLVSKTESGARANERIFLDRLLRVIKTKEDAFDLPAKERERIINRLVESVRNDIPASGPYTLPGLMPNVAPSRVVSLFDFKGPNIVIDMGDKSLVQSLQCGAQFLYHNDCKLVFAGGMNAFGHPESQEGEAVLMMAMCTPETASQFNLPVLTQIELSAFLEKAGDAEKAMVTLKPFAQKGAKGIPGILKTLSPDVFEQFPQNTTESPLRSVNGKATIPKELPKSHAYVQGTPIHHHSPRLHPDPPKGNAVSLQNRRILFLTDQAGWWKQLKKSGALEAMNFQVASPKGAGIEEGIQLDLDSDESMATSIQSLDQLDFDTVIAIKDLSGSNGLALLDKGIQSERPFLDLLYAVSRHVYNRVFKKKIAIHSVCLNAFRGEQLLPFSGLVAGFMKSLARELEGGQVGIINTDNNHFLKAIRYLETESGEPWSVNEVCYRNGVRHTFQLQPLPSLAADKQPYLDENSVVIATGGGRGVTAVLVEEMLRQFKCTVIALGRTDPEGAPAYIRTMGEMAFIEYEPAFYKEEIARDKSQKITSLKQKYRSYGGVNELNRVFTDMKELPGKFDYRKVDISDPTAIKALIRDLYKEYGRLDMVVHGAGIQISGSLLKKSLYDFRRIVATKLASLSYLYSEIEKQKKDDRPVHYHLLTSAFSYMGNDGQPDYGAANEAMNRIAALMDQNSTGANWSTMAWLGWAGIGMTRSSEFAALAAKRRLRGVTREEGQEIFHRMMEGRTTTPINIQVADGEIKYYNLAMNESPIQAKTLLTPSKKPELLDTTIDFTVENLPFIMDHVVNGIPTMPAAFLMCLSAEIASRLRPGMKILGFERAFSHKFIRVYPDRGVKVRIRAVVVREDAHETEIDIQIMSDFVHKSGTILQKDIVHNETTVLLSPKVAAPPAPAFEYEGHKGIVLADPYVMPGSNVNLGGPFDSLEKIIVGKKYHKSYYQLIPYSYSASEWNKYIPAMIMIDSLCRFGTVQVRTDDSLAVYVPVRCGSTRVYFDFLDFNLPMLKGKFTFYGSDPVEEGQLLFVNGLEARDSKGSILIQGTGGVCQKYGVFKKAIPLNATL